MNAPIIRPDWWDGDEWSTPPHFFAAVSKNHGPFDLDPCCRPETAKAPVYFTKDNNGLKQDWFGRVWINPPYSNPSPWCEKAATEVAAGRAELVVMLLPAAVDTHWFHNFVVPYADVEFIRGRMRFIDFDGKPSKGSPKGGNVLALYRS